MMGVVDIILIVLSVISCMLSFIAVCLVRLDLERKREAEIDIRARKESHVQLSSEAVSKIIIAAESMANNNRLQVIQVSGMRITQKPETKTRIIKKRRVAQLRS